MLFPRALVAPQGPRPCHNQSDRFSRVCRAPAPCCVLAGRWGSMFHGGQGGLRLSRWLRLLRGRAGSRPGLSELPAARSAVSCATIPGGLLSVSHARPLLPPGAHSPTILLITAASSRSLASLQPSSPSCVASRPAGSRSRWNPCPDSLNPNTGSQGRCVRAFV